MFNHKQHLRWWWLWWWWRWWRWRWRWRWQWLWRWWILEPFQVWLWSSFHSQSSPPIVVIYNHLSARTHWITNSNFFFFHSFRLYWTYRSLSHFLEPCVHSHLTLRTVRTTVVPHTQCPASCLLEILVCICLSACRHPSLEILIASSQLQLPLPDT